MWLYGAYGRFRLSLNQKMLRVLLKNVPSLSQKVALVKELLVHGPQQSLQCHFNVNDPLVEQDWEKSVQWVLNKDEWIVDQFLHCNEKEMTMEVILNLLEGSELELDEWISNTAPFLETVKSEQVKEEFEKLSNKDRLIVTDLLHKPDFYVIAAKLKK